MAGADLSLVTVGLSLTVKNGFPPLERKKAAGNKSNSCAVHVSVQFVTFWDGAKIVYLVSLIRSLTRGKEPLHSHWQERPVVMREWEEKRPLEWKQKGGNIWPAPSPSSCEEKSEWPDRLGEIFHQLLRNQILPPTLLRWTQQTSDTHSRCTKCSHRPSVESNPSR